jgi:hypothetical protein
MKTLTQSDLVFAIIPLLALLLHALYDKVSKKDTVFNEGLPFVCGIYSVGLVLLIFTEHGQTLTILSCLLRPTANLLHYLTQLPAVLYNKKHPARASRRVE